MKQAPLRYWMVVLLTQLTGAVVILVFCIWFWHTSWLPTAVFLGFMVVPVLFHAILGAFGLDPTKTCDAIVKPGSDAPALGQRIQIAAIPILVSGLFGVAILLSFLLPDTRIAIVQTTSAQRWQTPAENALWDTAPNVRLAACVSIQEHSADVSNMALLDALGTDDALIPCIMPTLMVGGENMVLAWRQGQWFETLMHQDKGGEQMCEIAGHLYHADRIGAATAVTQLFTCAAAASTPQAQECCAQSLRSIRPNGQSDVIQLLPTPDIMANSAFAMYARDYLEVAHRTDSTPLTPLTGETFKRWSVELACHSLQGASKDVWQNLEPTFSQVVSSATCDAPALNDQTLRLWQATCGHWIDPKEPVETLCQRMRQVSLEDAINRARRSAQTATFRASYTHEPLFTFSKRQEYEQKQAAFKDHPLVARTGSQVLGMEQLMKTWGLELPASDSPLRMMQIEQLQEVIRTRQFKPSNQR